MGKPSKGTPADKRLKANKTATAKATTKSTGFGGKKAAPFAKGGGRKRG